MNVIRYLLPIQQFQVNINDHSSTTSKEESINKRQVLFLCYSTFIETLSLVNMLL